MRINCMLIIILALISSCTVSKPEANGAFVQEAWFNDSLLQIIKDARLDSTFNAGEDGQEQI